MPTASRVVPPLLLLLMLLLLRHPVVAKPLLTDDSTGIAELLGDINTNASSSSSSSSSRGNPLQDPDPYDEFAEPPGFDKKQQQQQQQQQQQHARIRRRLLWQLARSREMQRQQRRLLKLGPLQPHRRPDAMGTADPYRELAGAAFVKFVRAVLLLRNRWRQLPGFVGSSGLSEFFEEGGSFTEPPGGTTLPPSPPVAVCPPKWLLGDKQCADGAKICFSSSSCAGTQCCFDGCRLRCLEPELLIRHVCTDYQNNTVFPGDVFMRARTSICTCDDLGRPSRCRYKKECVDKISASLFKLGFTNERTAHLTKIESPRQKLYNALNEAFKHIKKVY